MSGLECLALACWGPVCLAWGCSKCCHSGRAASREWEEASFEEFHDVPRICRIVLAVYEKDIENPIYADKLIVEQVVKRADYKDNDGMCPPYIIYMDHEAKDICLAIRGLNMANLTDFKIMMDHKKGAQKFDGGYVHHGLLKSAAWLLDKEYPLLEELAKAHPGYTVTFAGHSLGSGVVAMMAVLLRKNIEHTDITLDRFRCYAIAPARSTSLNLAVRYADVINSIVLQDDFLPRTSEPIEMILGASFCLPCVLCERMCKDIFVSDAAKLRDPRRLYVPGRLYHVLYTSDFSCRNSDPVVLTAVPVDHRFEHIIFSRTTVDDHSIVHMEKVTEKAVLMMHAKQAPAVQSMRKDESLERKRMEEVVNSLYKCKSMGVHNPKNPDEVASELTTPAASRRKTSVDTIREDAVLEGPAAADAVVHSASAPAAVAGDDQANGHHAEEGAGTPSRSPATSNGRHSRGSSPRTSELEEIELDPKSLPVPQRWKEAVRKVQMKPKAPSQKWSNLLASLLEEEEEGEGSPAPKRRPLVHLPSVNLTGAT